MKRYDVSSSDYYPSEQQDGAYVSYEDVQPLVDIVTKLIDDHPDIAAEYGLTYSLMGW